VSHVDYLNNTKTAIGTVLATIGAGLALTLDMIPDDIGKLASLLGIVLSVILIYNHVRARHLHSYHAALEERAKHMEELEKELKTAGIKNEALYSVLDKMMTRATDRKH
jgi:hypothetical protein